MGLHELNGLYDGSPYSVIALLLPVCVSAGHDHHHSEVLDASVHRPPQSCGLPERSAYLPSDAGLLGSGPSPPGKDLQ